MLRAIQTHWTATGCIWSWRGARVMQSVVGQKKNFKMIKKHAGFCFTKSYMGSGHQCMSKLIQVSWIYWAVWLCSLARFCLRVLHWGYMYFVIWVARRSAAHTATLARINIPWLLGLWLVVTEYRGSGHLSLSPSPSVDTFIVDSRVNGYWVVVNAFFVDPEQLYNYIVLGTYEVQPTFVHGLRVFKTCIIIYELHS